jgi:subtilisin family serine protease
MNCASGPTRRRKTFYSTWQTKTENPLRWNIVCRFKRLAGQYIETDVDLGGDIHAITLKEAALPSSLAPELKEAGAGRSIAYIQTDSKLSLLGAETAPSGQATATTQWEDASMPKGGAVLVALLDTGVDVAHPALEGWMTEGYNATNDTHVIHDSSRPWMEAHGTHVAGLIADTAYTYGAPVKILPVQVFADGEARVSDVLKALAYAKIQEAAIGNLSFGTSESSPALYEALRDSDMLFVCAAGNHHRDTNETPSYPAAYDLPNVLSVTSVNRDGGLSYFSDYGHVDLAAPGRGIVSALPGGNRGAMTGTSLSAGLVSGAAAVVSAHGAYTAAELKQRLLGTADRLDNLQDKVPGGRRLNVDNALSGRPGQILMLHPKEDFDASGYSDTPETRLHLYAQSGAVVQAAAGATHTLILKEDQIQT